MKTKTHLFAVMLLGMFIDAQASLPAYNITEQTLTVPLIELESVSPVQYYSVRLHCHLPERTCDILNIDKICDGFSPGRPECADLPNTRN